MALPRSVRDQAKLAARHFEKPEVEEETPAAAPEEGANEPDVEDPAKPALEPEEQPFEDKEKDEPKKDEEDRDARYWRHRYDVLQGKYNSEVPKLHQEVRELKQTIAEKDRELETASKSAGNPQGDLTDEQMAEFKEAFGEEVVDFVARMVEQKAGTKTDDSKVEELNERISRFEQEKAEDAEARFWSDLEEAVPNYLKINQDPAFLRWLGEYNPKTGTTYQEALVSAQQAGNALGVADVFKLFLKQSPGTSEPAQKKGVPEEDIEPRASGNSTPPPSAGRGRVWSGSDISDFYRDRMKGKFSREEAERLEADIFAAQKEGRVVR